MDCGYKIQVNINIKNNKYIFINNNNNMSWIVYVNILKNIKNKFYISAIY